jgi:Undecaprenyl-phosphate glucose phosphotransferase
VALVEGAAALAIVVGSALAYHRFVLGTELAGFAWQLYLVFGIVAGSLHGFFSAIACGRFLDGDRSPRSTIPDSLYGWTAAIALTLLVAFLSGSIGDLSRVSLTTAYVAGVPLVVGLRRQLQNELAQRIQRGILHYERVAVVGARRDVVQFLTNSELWKHGHRLTGALFLDDVRDDSGLIRTDEVSDFARHSVQQQTDYIVVVGALSDLDSVEQLVRQMKRFALNVVYAPATSNRTLKILDVVPIGVNNALLFMRKPMTDAAVFIKRAMDIVLSFVGLLLLFPVFVVVGIAIRLESPGPVFFRQERRGFNGQSFVIWKFRSMRVIESGRAMRQVRQNDPRVTRLGRFLRASSIDELPQLVNVLAGQMSIVGPRPHAISHDEELSRQLETYAHRQRIKPGITGWAQVNGFRGETTTFDQVEGRILHDLHYIDNCSLFLDLWIILLTIFSSTTRRNAH